MFDFEKFEVYKKAKDLAKGLLGMVSDLKGPHPRIVDQLQRASLSIPLNIAEGQGVIPKPTRKTSI